jgi:methylated-DNA-[protein]-cysteine S-methyltransferase
LVNFQTPWGPLEVEHDEQQIFHARFSSNPHPSFDIKTSFCQNIATEILSYQNNPRHRFQLPLNPLGSSFQKKVWSALLAIPSGDAPTYGELATLLNSSPRAIGQGCKTNPIALFIPCHRVVAKGSIGGFMGRLAQLSIKASLLEHEERK